MTFELYSFIQRYSPHSIAETLAFGDCHVPPVGKSEGGTRNIDVENSNVVAFLNVIVSEGFKVELDVSMTGFAD